MIVAIDPGKKASGWAAFVDGDLVRCGYTGDHGEIVASIAAFGWLPRGVDEAIIEAPRVYDRRRWQGDPNDLVDIAIAGGILLGALRPTVIRIIRPQEWKGQTPKAIQAKRTLAKLSAVELELVESAAPKSKRHNVTDAVGIGLWHIRR